ncbi:pre-rRNA-processing protein esf1-like [Silene latifolia]|uniref:pre-rRNA-processing protein esf1-like n=1 Tax=Silene latifolia TaxID=37657 RepID=UPI003D774AB3
MGSKNKNKRKTAANNSGDNAGKEENKLIKDERFSKAHYDPRFQNVPKNKAKVKVDSRFNTIFTNKNFGAISSAAIDKRGKRKVRSENELLRYYHSEAAANKKTKLMMKKKLEEEKESESSESFEPTDATDTDIDTDADELFEDDDSSVEMEDVPVIEKQTHRLSVVNMDWSQVTAVDLYVMLSSWLPKGGQIKSVAVYPSDFGIQRMEEEAVRGPVALFEDVLERDEGDEDADETSYDDEDTDEVRDNDEDRAEVSEDENVDDAADDDEDGVSDNEDVVGDEKYVGIDSEDKGENEDAADDDEEDADDDEIYNEKLRAYEKSRLRYYYAVVDCDSVATADYLYKACDGIEFERSSNVLDLRFIPDSMEIKHQPRDVATEAPAEYEGLDFQTRALQQSNTVHSWDDDEPHRVKTLRRNFSKKQLAEMESSEYLASSESGSDEDETGDENPSEKKKKAEILRALIPSGDGDDESQNMEVTFATGLEDINKKILEKEKRQETVFESYHRKKKEKKIARKNKTKTLSDDDSKKDGKGKRKKEKKTVLENEAEASRAELELLAADENVANKKLKGYNMKHKKAKGKKGEETPDDTNLPTVHVDDPRFSALFNNPGYALDPTDPNFKRSATYYRQLAHTQQKTSKEHENVEPMEPSIQKKSENTAGTSQKDKHELSAMIKSIKMKAQQLSVPSTVKRKNKTESNGSISGTKHKLPGSDRATKKARHHILNISIGN